MMEIIKMIALLVWIVVGLLSIAGICVSLNFVREFYKPFKEMSLDENEEAE